MPRLVYKVVHITPADPGAWQLLVNLHRDGWKVEWSDYAAGQYHFLLVGDE